MNEQTRTYFNFIQNASFLRAQSVDIFDPKLLEHEPPSSSDHFVWFPYPDELLRIADGWQVTNDVLRLARAKSGSVVMYVFRAQEDCAVCQKKLRSTCFYQSQGPTHCPYPRSFRHYPIICRISVTIGVILV